MKRIAMLMVIVTVSLTIGMGQSRKRAPRPNTDTASQKEICRLFIVDRAETRWTDSGPVSTLHGHVEKKGCVEPKTPPAPRNKTRTKRF